MYPTVRAAWIKPNNHTLKVGDREIELVDFIPKSINKITFRPSFPTSSRIYGTFPSILSKCLHKT